jgi:hypothetical protein
MMDLAALGGSQGTRPICFLVYSIGPGKISYYSPSRQRPGSKSCVRAKEL